MVICNCPNAPALPDVPEVVCKEKFGQIQKVAFQRLRNAAGVANSFTSETAITALASWTPKLTAADGTKIVVTPYVEAPVAEAGAPREFGGGNDTPGGIPMIIGREPTPFTAVMRQIPQEVIRALKELQCEDQNLGVFLFDENGAIRARQDATDEDTFYPIPIRSFYIGDLSMPGIDTPESNAIQWSFMPNWSDYTKVVAPAFNPLTDLRVTA